MLSAFSMWTQLQCSSKHHVNPDDRMTQSGHHIQCCIRTALDWNEWNSKIACTSTFKILNPQWCYYNSPAPNKSIWVFLITTVWPMALVFFATKQLILILIGHLGDKQESVSKKSRLGSKFTTNEQDLFLSCFLRMLNMMFNDVQYTM